MTHDEDLLHKRMKRLLKAAPDGRVEFKNYKDMCEKLKLPVKTSDSKNAQLNKLSYFCNLEKSEKGHGLYFTEVYPDPDKLILQKHEIVMDAEALLLTQFLTTPGNTAQVLLTDYGLWQLFGFINNKFSDDYFEKKFKDEHEISNKQFSYFKDRSVGRFQDVIMSTLNKLKDRSYIEYFPAKIVTEQRGQDIIQREATPEEIQEVLDYQLLVLKQMGYKSLKEIRNDGKTEKFYERRSELIRKNNPTWLYFSSGFRIITSNKKWLKEGLRCSLEERTQHRININSTMVDTIINSAQITYDNYNEQLNKEFASYKRLHKNALLEDNKDRCPTYSRRRDIMENDFLNNFQSFVTEFIELNNNYASIISKK